VKKFCVWWWRSIFCTHILRNAKYEQKENIETEDEVTEGLLHQTLSHGVKTSLPRVLHKQGQIVGGRRWTTKRSSKQQRQWPWVLGPGWYTWCLSFNFANNVKRSRLVDRLESCDAGQWIEVTGGLSTGVTTVETTMKRLKRILEKNICVWIFLPCNIQ